MNKLLFLILAILTNITLNATSVKTQEFKCIIYESTQSGPDLSSQSNGEIQLTQGFLSKDDGIFQIRFIIANNNFVQYTSSTKKPDGKIYYAPLDGVVSWTCYVGDSVKWRLNYHKNIQSGNYAVFVVGNKGKEYYYVITPEIYKKIETEIKEAVNKYILQRDTDSPWAWDF